MADQDDDLVFESTTDTPEQIADGLGVTAETSDEDAVTPEGNEVEAEPVVDEVVPPVVAEPAKRVAKPQRKTADAAAAAARKSATARASVLEVENEALKARLRELAAGAPAKREEAAPVVVPGRAPVSDPIKPSDIPDSHPAIQAVQADIAKLGPRPKQDDFADYDKFEEAKDLYIENRATLRAKMDYVRQDVATRDTIARDSAIREQHAINDGFAKTVGDARQRHEDYDDVMAEATEAGLRIGLAVGDTLRQSPIGAEVLYYLAQNPTEVDRINALSPYRALAEVGMIEGRIAAALRPLQGQRTTPARAAARVTRAPDPQETYLGDGPGAGKRGDITDPNISLAEYNRLRNEMDVASGRRTH